MGSVPSYLLAILALGMLIVVHEGGHYLVARWSGMRVERFSLGFGPALLKWRYKDTQFQLAPLPFGGFVQITGMNPHEEFDANDPYVYPNRPTILRFLTIFAGPFTNILFAAFIMFTVYAIAGADVPTGLTQVMSVKEGQPAYGNIMPGDLITKVDGQPVTYADNGFRTRVLKSEGHTLAITVMREGVEKVVSVTPTKASPDSDYMVGIGMGQQVEMRPLNILDAGWHAVVYPVTKSKEILTGLWMVVTRQIPADGMSAIGIVQVIREQIRIGWVSTFEFLAMLNVYLGLFNLLPLPALDGGRLVFLGYEMATRRRPNPKVEAAVHMAGFAVLFVLIIMIMFKEIKGFVT